MNPEKIRGYMYEERELRKRIASEQASYETDSPSQELSLEERFTALCERAEALPGMRSLGYENSKQAEVYIPEGYKTEDISKDSLRVHLTISYMPFKEGQDRNEAGGEVVCLVATWRDPFAASKPLLEQYVFAKSATEPELSILEDSITAAEGAIISSSDVTTTS